MVSAVPWIPTHTGWTPNLRGISTSTQKLLSSAGAIPDSNYPSALPPARSGPTAVPGRRNQLSVPSEPAAFRAEPGRGCARLSAANTPCQAGRAPRGCPCCGTSSPHAALGNPSSPRDRAPLPLPSAGTAGVRTCCCRSPARSRRSRSGGAPAPAAARGAPGSGPRLRPPRAPRVCRTPVPPPHLPGRPAAPAAPPARGTCCPAGPHHCG